MFLETRESGGGKEKKTLEGYWPNHLSIAFSPTRGCVAERDDICWRRDSTYMTKLFCDPPTEGGREREKLDQARLPTATRHISMWCPGRLLETLPPLYYPLNCAFIIGDVRCLTKKWQKDLRLKNCMSLASFQRFPVCTYTSHPFSISRKQIDWLLARGEKKRKRNAVFAWAWQAGWMTFQSFLASTFTSHLLSRPWSKTTYCLYEKKQQTKKAEE